MKFVSAGALELTGYRPEELVENRVVSYGKLIHEEDRNTVWETIQKTVKSRSKFTLEYRIVTREGLVKWVWERGQGVFAESGALLGLEGFITDITGMKEAEKVLKATMDRLRRIMGSVIEVIIAAVEARDPYTAGHQRRVGDLARAVAAEMGLPPEEAEGIRIAGVIHDLGKISVPAEILSKPRKLSDMEFALVKEHPQKGYEILKEVDFDWPVADMVRQHHERLDGSGYPQGLEGEEIVPGAKILAVADVVEAMASHRPYRPNLGLEAALEEITSGRGVLYDPEVVDACLRLFNEKQYRLPEP
jgi:PAS domain S-box-containing protein/putative nucleotidyltransferase with HDIG domain